jgi:hypothetical protein
MSDKKMLNESTIRKMMKLANIPSLTDSFIKETYYNYAAVSEQEEEELDVELDDEPALDDAPMEEPEMDLELDVEEPAGGDLPAAEELVQDLMGVLEKHFEEIDFNVDVEGDEEPMDAPALELGDEEEEVSLDMDEPADDLGAEAEVDIDVEEEEPVLEEVPGNLADLGAMAADADEEEKADADMMPEDDIEECGEVAEMEDEIEVGAAHSGLNSDLIDAIAAKVAERLLAEAKKTNK